MPIIFSTFFLLILWFHFIKKKCIRIDKSQCSCFELFRTKREEKRQQRRRILAIFAVGLLAGIVLLSISYWLCRVPHRSRPLRIHWELSCLSLDMKICALIPYFILVKESFVFFHFPFYLCMCFLAMCSVSLFGCDFVFVFFFALLLSYCRWWYTLFAIEDLWLWLWNSLNTLIFTRAHLTMRYIALFLFRLFVAVAATTLNWMTKHWFDREQVRRITKIACAMRCALCSALCTHCWH